MVHTLRLQANYLKSERNRIKKIKIKRHLSHIKLSILLSNYNVPGITMNMNVCVCVCVQGVLCYSHCVVTCPVLLYVPPEDPVLLCILKSCVGWSKFAASRCWSRTLRLAAPTTDAGGSWTASTSLINSSAGWTEMERYRQWKERRMFQNTLLFLEICF